MQKTPYPYCPHGNYVGGCGVDYMCGRCEHGGDEITPREQAAYVAYLNTRLAEQVRILMKFMSHRHAILALCLAEHRNKVIAASKELAEIRRWAKDEDDAGWLARRHRQAVIEWHELSDEDQFNNLPAYVLDGAY